MKRILFFSICLLCSFSILNAQVDRTKAPRPAKAKKIQLGDYQTFKLDNGLMVILVENHELPTVTFSLQLALDPIREGDQSGTASMAGSLLRTGTTTRTKAKIDEEIDFIGGSLNTGQSYIEASSLKKHQDKLLDLMTDVLYHPIFPQDEFDKLKKQTMSALAMSGSDPNSIASMVSRVLRYGKNHPYGEPTTEKTVGNVTLDGVKNYYKTYFTPTIGYLIMIGDLRLDEAKQLAGKYFSEWKSTPVTFEKFADPATFKGNRVAVVDKAGAVQSVITITNTINLKPGDPDILPATLMNNILGGGVFSGRLMMNLRESKAYTYGARSQLSSDKLIGYFSAGAQVRNAVTDSSITQFLYEMRRLRDEPVSKEDLRMAKNVMAGEFGRALENPSTLASFAMNTVRFHLPSDYYSTYLQRLEKITIADVQAMAKKYLQPDNCIILVVGNQGEVADKLKSFATSGEVEVYDKYGDSQNNKAVVLPEGMTAANVIDLYIQAIGGKQKIHAIKQITTDATGKMEMNGQKIELNMHSVQIPPDHVYQEMKMGKMLLSTQVYNGTEGWVKAMGQNQELKDKDLEKMKEGAALFPELTYFAPGFKTTLTGVESIDGRPSYQVKIIYPSGNTDVEYYEISTGLKIRKVNLTVTGEETVETLTDFGDYQAVSGVLFPFTMKQKVSGQMLDIHVDKMDTTTEIDLNIFKK